MEVRKKLWAAWITDFTADWERQRTDVLAKDLRMHLHMECVLHDFGTAIIIPLKSSYPL